MLYAVFTDRSKDEVGRDTDSRDLLMVFNEDEMIDHLGKETTDHIKATVYHSLTKHKRNVQIERFQDVVDMINILQYDPKHVQKVIGNTADINDE